MKISNVTVDVLPSELQEMLIGKLFISGYLVEYESTESFTYMVSFIDLEAEIMVEIILTENSIREESVSLESIKKAIKLYPEVFGKGMEQ